MLTEALNLATQRLAAAGMDQQHFLEGEIKATKMLHAAAAEVEVLRSVLRSPWREMERCFHTASNEAVHDAAHDRVGPDLQIVNNTLKWLHRDICQDEMCLHRQSLLYTVQVWKCAWQRMYCMSRGLGWHSKHVGSRRA